MTSTCGWCSYEESNGELIEQCAKCKAADASNAVRPDHPLASGLCLHDVRMDVNCPSCAAEETRNNNAPCAPKGIMQDAFGNPRTRAVRISLGGSHLICRPHEVNMNIEGEDRDCYTFSDVWLSDWEIERLPEFEGW